MRLGNGSLVLVFGGYIGGILLGYPTALYVFVQVGSSASAWHGGVLKDTGAFVITHDKNRGKGQALKTGILYARDKGFSHAVTIDADGQHFPEDIPVLIEVSEQAPAAIVVGCRNLTSENMPRKNTFANRFSNFWFKVQTARKLEDTQSGFRIYPLNELYGLWLITSRYEAELELMVFAAWHGVQVKGVPVRVLYQPEGERVSHFHPFRDFFRISVLNTLLCFGAVLYGLPLALFRLMSGKSHG